MTFGVVLGVLIGLALGFFGGGGSILTVPLLVYVFGLEAKQAIAGSLFVVGAASLVAALAHLRAGNVRPATAFPFGAAGMAGAFAGGRVAAHVDGPVLLLLFAGMMVLTALALWRGRPAAAPDVREPSFRRLLLQGSVVGFFTGLVGAGGGFLIVPALVLWAGLAMPSAVGTSLVIIVLNCAAGLLGLLGSVRLDFAPIAALTAAAVVGSVFGARLALRVDPGALRRAFAVFVLVVAGAILFQEGDRWLDSAARSLPTSAPQIVLLLLVLAAGILAGRVSAREGGDPLAGRMFEDGGGI
jgi:uncharacterized membrane protein YfcA